jgi:hypothetical protein
MSDQAIHRMTIIALVVVALIAAIVSFIHIYSFAVDHHQLRVAASLYPFSVDALVAVVTFSMFRAVNRGQVIPKMAYATLGLAVAATLAANFAYGYPYGYVSAMISCWPAAAFVCAIECAVQMVRKEPETKKIVTPRIEAHISSNGGHTATPAVKQAVKRSRARRSTKPVLTNKRAAEIAAERGVTPRTVRNHPEWWKVPEVAN